MSRPFAFKQFTIHQEKSPMKVGTDAVLLGAWCNLDRVYEALDIGAGTGVLSLMIAQRTNDAFIKGIEINPVASAEAQSNVRDSPWSDRVQIIHANVEEFEPVGSYDLIISNPPFFHADLKSQDQGKSQARHAEAFSYKSFANTSEWLSENGRLAGIYPVDVYVSLRKELEKRSFYPERIRYIKPSPAKEAHRVLFEFSRGKKSLAEESPLLIETGGRHQYSDEYKALTRHFYLNF